MNKIFTSYARTGLYLALNIVLSPEKNEALLPAFTCATTVTPAILMAGGKPIFVEVNREDLSMNFNDLLSKITSKTSVILFHHYYGFFNEKSLKEICKLAKEKNITVIEDRAHCYGIDKEPIGDIVVYSFSKNLNNPGGGLVITNNLHFFKKMLSFQNKNKKFFHTIVTNYEAFSYLEALKVDRNCDFSEILRKGKKLKELIQHLPIRIFVKMLKVFNLYPEHCFYKINSEKDYEIGKKIHLDTRITKKQLKCIQKNLQTLREKIAFRIKMAQQINTFISSYFPIQDNVFTNYVIFREDSSEITEISKVFRELGIKTRRPWPFFQKYWKAQLTKTVNYLKERLLLIDLDCITSEKLEVLREKFS